MQHIAVFGSAQGIRWCLNHIHSMKYAEVISASIAANSAGIDYSNRSASIIMAFWPDRYGVIRNTNYSSLHVGSVHYF